MEKLILNCPLCPGDVMTLTAAVESLHAAFPGKYQTDVRTSVPAIWQHNPWITPLADGDARRIDCQYPSIGRSNQVSVPFLGGYTEDLAQQLGVPIPLAVNRPYLYLSDEEKGWINQVRELTPNQHDRPYWLVNAGVKGDYPAKAWPIEHYQQVIDLTRGKILWIQIGEAGHNHPELRGVLNLVGKTDTRQLIRLAYHACGGLGPVTFLQHLMAAWQKPYVCLLGGREPATWVQYPLQHTLHAIGSLDCCRTAACWKSKIEADCSRPVLGLARPAGQCMAMIRPEEVLMVLDRLTNV